MSLIVNFFAGPGAGKSTMRAGVFADLKAAIQSPHIRVEEVTEYAKDLTYEHRDWAIGFQPYVFAKTWRNIQRLADKVDVILVDSPLLLSAVYMDLSTTDHLTFAAKGSLRRLVVDAFNSYDNLNFRIQRVKPYQPYGRRQTESEARGIDDMIDAALDVYSVPHYTVTGDMEGRDCVTAKIVERMVMGVR